MAECCPFCSSKIAMFVGTLDADYYYEMLPSLALSFMLENCCNDSGQLDGPRLMNKFRCLDAARVSR